MRSTAKRKAIRLVLVLLVILLVVLLTIPLLAHFGLMPYGPSDAEIAELDERWAELFEYAPPASGDSNRALAVLDARYDELGIQEPKGVLDFDSLTAPERQLVEDFQAFAQAAHVSEFGRRDALPLIKQCRLALAIHPPVELPIPKLLQATDRMLTRGDLVDALLSFGLAVDLLEAAAARGLSQKNLALARKPTSEDLAHVLLTDLNTNWNQAVSSIHKLRAGSSSTLRKTAQEFQLFAMRNASADYAERVWAARADLNRLAKQNPIKPPGALELFIWTVFGSPSASRASIHASVEKTMARSIHQWRKLQADWDHAVASLPGVGGD